MPLLPKKLLVVVLLQLVILASLPLYKSLNVAVGTDVLLEVTPVISHSTAEGTTVVLVYGGLTQLTSDLIGQKVFVAGEPVFVALRQVGVGWVPSGASSNKPPQGTTYIRGVVAEGNAVITADGTRARLNTNRLVVRYGIEDYVVAEGTVFPSGMGAMRAQVALEEGGEGVLKQLFVDDQPWP